ncbi:unnamed protein product [Caretta caretta]
MDWLNLVEASMVSMASRLQEESRLNLSCLEERLDSLVVLLLGILSSCKLSYSDSVPKMSIQAWEPKKIFQLPIAKPMGLAVHGDFSLGIEDNLLPWILHAPSPVRYLGREHKKSEQTFPQDCAETHKQRTQGSGICTIQPIPLQHPFEAYCDMVTDGDGWTVFQCQQDGSLDFTRTWQEYRLGFGSWQGESWLGNKQRHSLTLLGQHALCMELEDWFGIQCHTTYHKFRGASKANKYQLMVWECQSKASNTLSYSRSYNHDHKCFITWDSNNDNYPHRQLQCILWGQLVVRLLSSSQPQWEVPPGMVQWGDQRHLLGHIVYSDQ